MRTIKEIRRETMKRKEVAKRLGVSGQTVDRYRLQGKLTPIQYVEGGIHRYDPIEVESFAKGRRAS